MKLAAAFLILSVPATVLSQTKCEANIQGFKIHTVYIMGSQPNGVAWAYKHISDETCLTPVTDPSKADAVLEIVPNDAAPTEPRPLTISCSSRASSTICIDSDGNQLSESCSGSACYSSYGPSLGAAAMQVFDEWVRRSWYESRVRIYTSDHKLIWRSEYQKGDWTGATWPDLVRLGTNSPVCKVGAWSRPKYKTFRHWASTTCGVVFDPPVSIDLRVAAKQKAAADAKSQVDEMKQNAVGAAKKQGASQP